MKKRFEIEIGISNSDLKNLITKFNQNSTNSKSNILNYRIEISNSIRIWSINRNFLILHTLIYVGGAKGVGKQGKIKKKKLA